MSQLQFNKNTFIGLFFAFALGSLTTSLIQKNQGKAVPDEGQPLLIFQGEDLALDALPSHYAMEFYQSQRQAYEEQKRILNATAIERFLSLEALKQGQSLDAVAAKIFDLTPPSEADVSAFYQQHKAQLGRPFFEVKASIQQHLLRQKTDSERAKLLRKLQQEGDLAIMLSPPVSPFVEIATADFPFLGPEQAPVHIVEFADYQCPHCKDAGRQLKVLLDKFGPELRLTYMDFPINASGISRVLAQAAYCAGQQGQYWPYHERIFAEQANLTQASAGQIAESLGLQMEAFAACLDSDAAKQHVAKSEQEAIRLGVRATPTIFINGKLYQGSLGEPLQQELARLLAAM